jgi:uncharacterized protein
MRTPRLAIIAGALASVFLAGTAHAATAPAFKPVLTKNPLYKTGKLAFKTCEEPEVNHRSEDEARVYFESVLDCLNKAWAPKVKQAGYAFTKSKLGIVTKVGAKTACGPFPMGAQAVYCSRDKSMTVLLSPEIIAEPTDLGLMVVLAHEYGHHLQHLTGMFKVETRYNGKNAKQVLDQSRRYELQADCLSGAFIGSTWDSLGRSQSDFDSYLKGTHNPPSLKSIGVEVRTDADQTHGTDANWRYWLKKGFSGKSAGTCNTWVAPKGKVR